MRKALAVIGLTLVWPVAQLAVFWLRFDRLPPGGIVEVAVFIPMGLVAGGVAVWLWSVSETPRRRRAVGIGYLLACPVAFLGALLGGLVLPGFWGPLVVGATPLVVGCIIGFIAGRNRTSDA